MAVKKEACGALGVHARINFLKLLLTSIGEGAYQMVREFLITSMNIYYMYTCICMQDIYMVKGSTTFPRLLSRIQSRVIKSVCSIVSYVQSRVITACRSVCTVTYSPGLFIFWWKLHPQNWTEISGLRPGIMM